MSRTRRIIAATVVAGGLTAVSFGHAPAASAAGGKTNPAGRAGISKAIGTKTEKRLLVAQRAVSALIAHKDAALMAANQSVTGSGIAQAVEVQANIESDRLHLAMLNGAATAATTVTEVRTIATQVRQVRPETYAVVVNGLRQAANFQDLATANQALIADLAAQTTAKESEGYDVTAVRELLANATATNDQVAPISTASAEQGVALTALSTRDQKAAFSANIAAAGTLLDAVNVDLQAAADALATMVPVTEPITEQPAT